MQRHSNKRDSILECLKSTVCHPSAEWVYGKVKEEYPSMSLATVYRNLLQLKEEGIIRSVGTVNGQERFDARVTPHTHAVCKKCGCISDVFDININEEFLSRAKASAGFSDFDPEVKLYGICKNCSEN